MSNFFEELRQFPDNTLAQMVQNPQMGWAALSELQKRQQVRESTPQQVPTGSLAQNVLGSIAPASYAIAQERFPMQAGLTRMRFGGIVRRASGGPLDVLMSKAATIDPAQYQTTYTTPQQADLSQSAATVRGMYGQGSDYSKILEQIEALKAQQANAVMSKGDVMQQAGLRMMASRDPNIMSSFAGSMLGAQDDARTQQQRSLENQVKLLSDQAGIYQKNDSRNDNITNAVMKFQEIQDQRATNEAHYADAAARGDKTLAAQIAQHNQSLEQQQAQLQQRTLESMADPNIAGIMGQQARSLMLDPAIANNPEMLKRLQSAAQFADGIAKTDVANKQRDLDMQAKKQIEVANASAMAHQRAQVGAARQIAEMGNGGLTPDALNYAADTYNATGKMVPGLARSKGAIQAILNRAAERAAMAGVTPGQATATPGEMKSNAAALADITKKQANIEANEETIKNQIPQLMKAQKGVGWTTGVPFFDEPLLWVKGKFGNQAAHDLLVNTNTIATEYAKVMTANGASTDSARQHAYEILYRGLNDGQMESAIKQLMGETEGKKKAFEAEKVKLRNGMTLDGLYHMTSKAAAPNEQSQATPASVANAKDPLGLF